MTFEKICQGLAQSRVSDLQLEEVGMGDEVCVFVCVCVCVFVCVFVCVYAST